MSDHRLNAQTTGNDGTNWVLRLSDDGSAELCHNGELFARVEAAQANDVYRAAAASVPRMQSLLEALAQDGGPIDQRAHAALMNKAKWLDDQLDAA